MPKLTSATKVKVRCFAAFAHRFDITSLLESFNNRQNRFGLKKSWLNSYRVDHFLAAIMNQSLVDNNTKLDTLTSYTESNTLSATD